MNTVGIDIGSRTVKVVVLNNGEISDIRKTENTFNTLEVCKELLEGINSDFIVATGYGRHLFKEHYETEVISEIKAFALGAKHCFPNCRTILDIGGQDTKVILLNDKGAIQKFEMNDKCAAGTGKFLEIMAMTLKYTLDEFGENALKAEDSKTISSMCTVFAESEVISMLAQGAKREDVAKGIHQSIINRSVAMMKRVGMSEDVVFVGGVALNKAMKTILGQALNLKINTPDDPQMIGALGCALHARELMLTTAQDQDSFKR